MHNYTFWEAAAGDTDTPPASAAHWWLPLPTPPPPPLPLPVQAPSSAHLFKVREAAFDQLPLSSPIRHPEERQRIIYLEKRKTLKVSASDRHDTWGMRRQERGAGFSSLWGLSPATHTPATLCTLRHSRILPVWPFGVFFPLRPPPTPPGVCDN